MARLSFLQYRMLLSLFDGGRQSLIKRFNFGKLPFNASTSAYRRLELFAKFAILCASFARIATFRYVPLKSMNGNEFEGNGNTGKVKIPKRLQRFRKFASIEYKGIEYMTPQDFLDSLTLDEPRERVFRHVLNDSQLKKILKSTPPLRRNSHKMFRELGQNGIISYAEYLFLLTLLTKSHYSFQIAFILFDEDDNMVIDKDEFLKVISLMISTYIPVRDITDPENCRLEVELGLFGENYGTELLNREIGVAPKRPPRTAINLFERLIASNSIFASAAARTNNSNEVGAHRGVAKLNAVSVGQNPKPSQPLIVGDTTLLIHLFGNDGSNSLSFDQFKIFYHHLQKELIEIEFHEFSRGKSEISAVDFARLVLRYSILHKEDQSPYIRRIYERSESDDRGISLRQFEQFSMFLNNLEEFSKAVKLYTTADIPVSQSEFIRAVKCATGFELDPHLVTVLFRIFDANSDDKLSYSEFIAVMNDRLHRGFKNYSNRKVGLGWRAFKDCVIEELPAKV